MPDVLNETLRGWQNFYFMTGGAAAALIGLMFVALSLGIGMASDVSTENFNHFVTPSIFYFTSALVFACIMLVPAHSLPVLALMTLAGGAVGFRRAVVHARFLKGVAREYQDFALLDWLGQIILPVLSFGLIIAGGICLLVNHLSMAFWGWWLAMILLLLCGIANTWSLVIWIIDQRKK